MKDNSFHPPQRLPGMSDIAFAALQLAALSERLALEDRTLVDHKTGRAENVAEHSAMLTIIAPAIAEMYYPNLNAGLVCRFAAIHDAVEAYVGDVSTLAANSELLRQKAADEAEGLARLKRDFVALPQFVAHIEQYEAQQAPEARFVRLIDKWTPSLIDFLNNSSTAHAYTDQAGARASFSERAATLREEYPDFVELIAVREELTELMANHLFS
jgi:5'-deoxynucleotidase YfbR-like HD superfamily hydrolase